MAFAGAIAGQFASAAGNVADSVITEAGDITEAVIHEVGSTFRDFARGPGPLPPHGCTTTAGDRCRTCEAWKVNWREHREFIGLIILGGLATGIVITEALAESLGKLTGDTSWAHLVGMPLPVGAILRGVFKTGGGLP